MSTVHIPSHLDWRKASASNSGGCVEVAPLPDGGVAVRDSKDRQGPILSFTRREWVAFLDGMERGEFDHLV
ncbi:MAG TPA: DUF397 domain-containing protein [Mycobacteriales bacterium]